MKIAEHFVTERLAIGAVASWMQCCIIVVNIRRTLSAPNITPGGVSQYHISKVESQLHEMSLPSRTAFQHLDFVETRSHWMEQYGTVKLQRLVYLHHKSRSRHCHACIISCGLKWPLSTEMVAIRVQQQMIKMNQPMSPPHLWARWILPIPNVPRWRRDIY